MTWEGTSTDIIRGVAALSTFLGINRKATTAYIKEGLPVTRIGVHLTTTPRAVLEWIEERAKRGAGNG